ncbi:MAG: hypothetical protein WHV28_09000 [Bacteroidota bacterium]
MKKRDSRYEEKGIMPLPYRYSKYHKVPKFPAEQQEDETDESLLSPEKMVGKKKKLPKPNHQAPQEDNDADDMQNEMGTHILNEDVEDASSLKQTFKTLIEQHSSLGMPSWMNDDKQDDRGMRAAMPEKEMEYDNSIKRIMKKGFQRQAPDSQEDTLRVDEANRPYKKAVKGLPPTGEATKRRFGEEPETNIEEVEEIYVSENGRPAKRIMKIQRSNYAAPKSKSGGWVKKLFDIMK